MAVGGNLFLNYQNYQIAPKDNNGFKWGGVPIGLAVRGGVSLNNNLDLKIDFKNYVKIGNWTSPNTLTATYNGGDLRVRQSGSNGMITVNANPGDLSTPPVSASNNPIFENVFGTGSGKIDIDAAFNQFVNTSNALAALTHNVVARNMDNPSQQVSGPFTTNFQFKPKFILNGNGINVLNVKASVWSSIQNEIYFENFTSNPGFALIVNILDASGEVKFPNSPNTSEGGSYVVFNFPNATSIQLKPNSDIDGTILAPLADVTKKSGSNLEGQVITKSFTHDGDEIHYREFKPSIPLPEDPEILAVDDVYGPYLTTEGGLTGTVLVNDKVNGELFDVNGNPLAVVLTPGTSPAPGKITMNPDGTITVAVGTPAGIYYYPYTICINDPAYSTICDDAVATITVICGDTTFIFGKVIDDRTNSPVPYVPVSLISQFAPVDTIRTWTNSAGEYRFKGAPEGEYLLQVQDELLIVTKGLFPVGSSLYWPTLVNCEPQEHDYHYNISRIPAIGDYVWIDVNGDGVQNEWFDANGDGRITKNEIDTENFETLKYSEWEWVDLNNNGKWDTAEDYGELNRGGVGNAAYANIRVEGVDAGNSHYVKNVIIGVDGVWRDRPYFEPWDEANGLFGRYKATLQIESTFEAAAAALARTGLIKTYDSNGYAVSTGARKAARIALGGENARVAATILTPHGTERDGLVEDRDGLRVNNDLDIGVNTVETLPVSLAGFTAEWNEGEKAVYLDWNTASEINNKGFEVEHSADARQWNKIGFVESDGQDKFSPSKYSFTHTTPSAGNNYYRLKQLDLSGGGFEYSIIRSVSVEGVGVASVYPNPAVDLLNVAISNRSGFKEMSLVDALGRSVKSYSSYEPVVNLSGLASGLYHLRVAYQDGTFENVKVLKK